MPDASTLDRAPAVLPSYLRALGAMLARRGRDFRPGDAVPRDQLTLRGVSLDSASLARYRAVCGFAGGRVPPTWPQVLAFPLHMRLMTGPGFPIPLAGLVHLSNEIHVRGALPVDATVDLVARVGETREVERGVEFDLEADMLHGGEPLWSARAVTLYRCRKGRRSGRRGDTTEAFDREVLRSVPADIGRRYARVSGDYNPIHLFAATARMLGFKRAIAHGMWTLATSLATVDADFEDAPRRIHCAFKLPVMLPGDVRLAWRTDARGCLFRLNDTGRGRPHLEGSVALD